MYTWTPIPFTTTIRPLTKWLRTFLWRRASFPIICMMGSTVATNGQSLCGCLLWPRTKHLHACIERCYLPMTCAHCLLPPKTHFLTPPLCLCSSKISPMRIKSCTSNMKQMTMTHPTILVQFRMCISTTVNVRAEQSMNSKRACLAILTPPPCRRYYKLWWMTLM